MTDHSAAASDRLGFSLGASHADIDQARVMGRFAAICRSAEGEELWSEEFDNLITTVGKNFLLDTALAGSAYTALAYMGLISNSSFTAVAAGDTMASHTGWLEANATNAPAYGATRPTTAWSAASAGVKALSAGLVFTFTGSGTVQGAFIVGGSGATSSNTGTVGILYSAGTLGTAQPVISTNTLTLSYSTTLT
jgi:hypothetical protein